MTPLARPVAHTPLAPDAYPAANALALVMHVSLLKGAKVRAKTRFAARATVVTVVRNIFVRTQVNSWSVRIEVKRYKP